MLRVSIALSRLLGQNKERPVDVMLLALGLGMVPLGGVFLWNHIVDRMSL